MSLNKILVNNTTTVNTGVVYDISKATSQSYDTLSAALGTNGNNVPPEVREGGMSIRFISNGNSDKYVQYRLMTNTFSTTESDWQGVDDEPTIGSNNLLKSKGIFSIIKNVLGYSSKDVISQAAATNEIRKIRVTEPEQETDVDFAISDKRGFAIVQFILGHLRTKNFDSSLLKPLVYTGKAEDVGVDDNEEGILNVQEFLDFLKDKNNGVSIYDSSKEDFSISDEQGYRILQCKNGHIMTKNFDSSNIPNTNSHPLKDKVITLYGDSITYGVGVSDRLTYSKMLKQLTEASVVNQNGYSGYRYGSSTNTLHDTTILSSLVQTNPDLLLIMGGTNDYWHDIPLGDLYGDITQNSYIETTSGGFRAMIEYLQTNLNKDSQIVICTPPPGCYNGHIDTVANGAGFTMQQYVERIKEIAQQYHISVINCWGELGWSPTNELSTKKFTADGVHLSVQGYTRLTSFQSKQLTIKFK